MLHRLSSSWNRLVIPTAISEYEHDFCVYDCPLRFSKSRKQFFEYSVKCARRLFKKLKRGHTGRLNLVCMSTQDRSNTKKKPKCMKAPAYLTPRSSSPNGTSPDVSPSSMLQQDWIKIYPRLADAKDGSNAL